MCGGGRHLHTKHTFHKDGRLGVHTRVAAVRSRADSAPLALQRETKPRCERAGEATAHFSLHQRDGTRAWTPEA